MTCKDCIHLELCHLPFLTSANACKRFFKDKSRFVELPCKVGDQIFYIKNASVFEYTVDKINYEFTATENGNIVRGIYFKPKNIGKAVFLSREEAEAKLKEIKNESYENHSRS